MPVKTRPRPRARPSGYRPRRPPARRRAARGSGLKLGITPGRSLLPWLAVGVVGALAIAMPWLAPHIVNAFEWVLSLFGVGLLLLITAAVLDVRTALAKSLSLNRGFLRVWAGLHLLLVTALGLLGLYKPGWQLGDVSFAEVSAGGDAGRLFVGSVLGVLGWGAASLAGLGLLWPPAARATGRTGLALLRGLVSLELPQRVGEALRSFFTALLPETADEDEEDEEAEPYVSKLDEEWSTPPQAAEAESEPPPVAVAGPETDELEEVLAGAPPEEESEIIVTSEPEEKPEAFQRTLPMGRPAGRGWELPPIDLLTETAEEEIRPVDNEARAQLIVETLASFGVNAKVVSINQGPTVTQFGVEPGWETKTRTVMVRDEKGKPVYDKDGKPQYRTEVVSRTRVRVNRITALANDLTLALAAPTIRIEAPVPGRPIIGIEVPNTSTSLVTMRSVIESTAFQRVAARSHIGLALGKGVSGEPVAADLGKMPHLLIAGATGSGKSVCINSIIGCLLMHNTPEDVRVVLIDPKRVELANFAGIPHLAFSKIITDVEDVVGTLQAIIHEMDSRYRRFASI
ncbi:MAG TPA: DNA translocase FtsK, partial [Dehalococcoidia bacterium]|nr:DNA translocase FtsK [Dehalococcoidia bacterium]